jgi:hypothetical protein
MKKLILLTAALLIAGLSREDVLAAGKGKRTLRKVKYAYNIAITRDMQRAQLDSIVTVLAKDDIEMKFDQLEYNADQQISKLALSVKTRHGNGTFSDDSFEQVYIGIKPGIFLSGSK